MEHRGAELKLEKRLGITKEIYRILRIEKRKQKKSMARIANDLILQAYGSSGHPEEKTSSGSSDTHASGTMRIL